jgi:hypothetical protein
MIIAFALFPACYPRMLNDLHKDDIDVKDGYNSLIILRFKITSQSRRFYFWDAAPSFWIADRGFTMPGKWIQDNDLYFYDEYLIAQAKPGDHQFNKLQIALGPDKKLPFHKNINFHVPPDRLVFFGTFDLAFREKVDDSYSLKIIQGKGEFESALEALKKRYPSLYARFQSKADIARLNILR